MKPRWILLQAGVQASVFVCEGSGCTTLDPCTVCVFAFATLLLPLTSFFFIYCLLFVFCPSVYLPGPGSLLP